MQHQVTIVQDEDGVFIAEVPSLPGCITQGATRAEAIKNIEEAIEIYIESVIAHGPPIPPPMRKETVKFDEAIKALSKFGYEIDGQKDGHIILRQTEYPFRRIVIPGDKEIAKGTLRGIVKQVGLTTVEEFKNLL